MLVCTKAQYTTKVTNGMTSVTSVVSVRMKKLACTNALKSMYDDIMLTL